MVTLRWAFPRQKSKTNIQLFGISELFSPVLILIPTRRGNSSAAYFNRVEIDPFRKE